MRTIRQFIRWTLAGYGGMAVIYFLLIRPAHMHWGATPEEAAQALPGDSFIDKSSVVSTRALTIGASPRQIWPWIAQLGQNKGGFYSYDWLENLFAAQMKNADSVHAEWQRVVAGDRIYYAKDGLYGTVSVLEPNRYLSMGGWTWYLKPVSSSVTRLLVRYPSFPVKGHFFTAVYHYLLFEPAHYLMEAGMMLGIKRRAEAQRSKLQKP